jgi:pilus assembly protein Flp/PilA
VSQRIARVRSFVAREEGATMVEYGLMVALIALVCIGAVALVGGQLSSIFNDVKNSLGTVP